MATEAQRLLEAHQVADPATVSLQQTQIRSATSHCACAQSNIEALTTREAALRSKALPVHFRSHRSVLTGGVSHRCRLYPVE